MRARGAVPRAGGGDRGANGGARGEGTRGGTSLWGRARAQKVREERGEEASGCSSCFRGLRLRVLGFSPLSDSGEWFYPKPQLAGDSGTRTWRSLTGGQPLVPLQRRLFGCLPGS